MVVIMVAAVRTVGSSIMVFMELRVEVVVVPFWIVVALKMIISLLIESWSRRLLHLRKTKQKKGTLHPIRQRLLCPEQEKYYCPLSFLLLVKTILSLVLEKLIKQWWRIGLNYGGGGHSQ